MNGVQVIDVSSTRASVLHMSKMIQVRNVPDELHRNLKMRAAATGLSLSDYIKRELSDSASRLTMEEIDARVRALGPSKLRTQTIVEILRESRGD
jgi:plasmid stability protein